MLPKGHAKAKIVPVRFKPEEFKAITRAAKASKQSLSGWIRGTLNAAV
jgi:predicted HicB family RNase H-like nuclease